MENNANNKAEYYIKLFRYLHNHREKYTKHKVNDEEFYYADVEDTRTQFTKDQLKTITEKYDIPISSKITYAIVESFRAHITGMDPYPRLIAVENKHKPWAQYWERVLSSIWYEAALNDEVGLAILDSLTTGSGFLHVRTNNYYKESTFNIIAEHVPWIDVYIDPASKKADLSDADYVCIARAKPIFKLEQEYGIKINLNDDNFSIVDPYIASGDVPYNFPDFGFNGMTANEEDRKHTKFAWEKLFYTAKVISQYIGDNGAISIEMPILTSIVNEEKQMLGQQIMAMQQQIEQQQPTPTGNMTVDQPAMEQSQQVQQQVEQMKQAYVQMPDYVEKYKLVAETADRTVFYVDSFVHQKQKRFIQVLQIDKKIMFEKVLATDVVPVMHFAFSHFRNPHKTYGIVHYTKDLVKGINKLWGLLLYDMQLRTSMRIIAADTAVQDVAQLESKFAIPGAVILYTPDPTLSDGGKPEAIDMGTVPSQLPALISMLVQLAEYVTGIFSLMQGNTEAAPPTFGATQSLQNFGSQRIKLTARGMERPLNLLIYNLLVYAQRHAPLEKLSLAMDPEKPEEMESIIEASSDAKYKVRTTLTNNLPTTRQTAAQMFTILAGQVADPMVQKLLIQEGLKLLDLRESDSIVEQMDTVTQMQQQMQQMQQSAQESQAQMQTMTQNMAQQKIALEVEKAKGNIKASQASAETEIQLTNNSEGANAL